MGAGALQRRQWQVKEWQNTTLERLFEQGRNITNWIKAPEKADNVSPMAILFSYDAQAGDGSAVDFLVGVRPSCLQDSLV
jgi:hypothetical protein